MFILWSTYNIPGFVSDRAMDIQTANSHQVRKLKYTKKNKLRRHMYWNGTRRNSGVKKYKSNPYLPDLSRGNEERLFMSL